MLRIRQSQMTHLVDQYTVHFAEIIVGQVATCWPDIWALWGAPKVQAFVREAVGRAQTHGMVSLADLTRYVNVALALGIDFDTDARYPWAGILLNDPVMRPGAKTDRICQRAERVLRENSRGAQ